VSRARWLRGSKLAAARELAAKHERTAQRTLAKLDASAAQVAQLKQERDELRRSYYFSGAGKKLDLREIPVFSEIAGRIISDRRTTMNYDRLYTLWQAVTAASPDAPIIEIGSWRGGSARFMAETLLAHDRTPRLYLCDTFAGHAETDAEIDTSHHESGKFEDTSAEAVAQYLAGYPAVELVVGDIAQTSGGLPDEAYALVHLDVDVYPTTAYCLRHFAPRLAPGALMVIDDYATRTCPGVKQAADEFAAAFPEYRLWHLLTGQALLWRR
jgi:predicted O-methyltransferase YrrM